jgi:ADP-ribose pyrophosphatase
MLKKLEKIEGETLAKNPWWAYHHDRYRLPDGSEGDYYFVHTPGSVMVVPITEQGKLLFVKQYRYLNSRESIEFPGGGIKEGQSASEAAYGELLEETGSKAGLLVEIGRFNPMNGVTDELCTVFKATDLTRATASPERTEEFEFVELTLSECRAAIGSGELWDGMTLAALALLDNLKESLNA